jgi:hypothetical protein
MMVGRKCGEEGKPVQSDNEININAIPFLKAPLVSLNCWDPEDS